MSVRIGRSWRVALTMLLLSCRSQHAPTALVSRLVSAPSVATLILNMSEMSVAGSWSSTTIPMLSRLYYVHGDLTTIMPCHSGKISSVVRVGLCETGVLNDEIRQL